MPYDAEGYPEIVVPDSNRVFQATRDGNCISFFGTGASMCYTFKWHRSAGYPEWAELSPLPPVRCSSGIEAQIVALSEPKSAVFYLIVEADEASRLRPIWGFGLFLYSQANYRGDLYRFPRGSRDANALIPTRSIIAQICMQLVGLQPRPCKYTRALVPMSKVEDSTGLEQDEG